MKKLIILAVLLSIFASCQNRSTTDGIARSVFATLKNNNIEAFRSLYMTSREMEMLIDNGTLKIPDSLRHIAISYYSPEEISERSDELFRKLRSSDDLAWSQLKYEACEVETYTDEGSTLYRIEILALNNGEVKSLQTFDAFLIPADPSKYVKEKFVIVK